MNRLSKFIFAFVVACFCHAQSTLANTATAIAASGYHTCALTSAGGVECWGSNYYGELGNAANIGTSNPNPTPLPVTGLSSGVIAITAGYDQTCALTSAGGVVCWGYNFFGELGNAANSGTTTPNPTPLAVTGLSSGVTAIAGGGSHTCALTSAGLVECWGNNASGQLGNAANNGIGNPNPTPLAVTGLSSGVTAIAAGGGHTCALTSAGLVECWGNNAYGQLGNVAAANRDVPFNVIGFGAPAIKNDFNGDGEADVLFINTTSSATPCWPSARKADKVFTGTINTGYVYAGSGDFDGDGKADLFFTKAATNTTLIWSGAVKPAATYPGTITAGFSVAAICDVDGDGKDDVIWYNATTGATRVWSGAVKTAVKYPGIQNTAYRVVACADFDGDGKADLFWRNATTGSDQVWLGGLKSSLLYPGNNTDLTVIAVGAGDTDGDGKADMVWYTPSTNAIRVWQSGLKAASSYNYFGTGATGFTPKAVADYDGDGMVDLLWGNDTTFATRIWPDFNKVNVTYPGTSPAGFSIQK